MTEKFPSIGTISEATLRAHDLAYAFGHCLKDYSELDRHQAIAAKAIKAAYLDEQPSAFMIEELTECLEEIAPPYTYFGTSEGDGADFGFWPDMSAPDCDEDLHKFSDRGAAMPEKFTGDAFCVNDHGNVTCGNYKNGELVTLYWDCV